MRGAGGDEGEERGAAAGETMRLRQAGAATVNAEAAARVTEAVCGVGWGERGRRGGATTATATEAARRREDGRSRSRRRRFCGGCSARRRAARAHGESFVTCGAAISVEECGGTQPKRSKSVEYILLGTLVTNIFPQDFHIV